MVALPALALLCWLGLLLLPSRPWDLQPVAERLPAPPPPATWPPVVIVVPARNEAASLPHTLPALLAQDYPGALRVVVVDERSSDGTAELARAIAARCPPALAARHEDVSGAPLPEAWSGKPWGMQQGLRHAGVLDAPEGHVLLTDADILHAPGSLRALVAQAEAGGVTLVSRMALLSCATPAERLLIPPFAFFFAVLYPMRRVNAGATAAAAGGCMLLDAHALHAMDGVAPIRDRVIDDVSLAQAVHARGGRLHLARSAGDVASLRVYDFGSLWRMVRRSAFVQLRFSWALLLACLAMLALVFAVPPLALAVGLVRAAPLVAGLGALGWAASAAAFLPAVRAFGLPAWRSLTLPLAGLLYGAMTLDAGLRHALGRAERWRG